MRHPAAIVTYVLCLILSATHISAIKIGDRAIQSKLANSTNEFACTLYKTISKSVNGGNIFLSPASISTALAMVYFGARGETRIQMTSVMRLDIYDSSGELSLKTDFKKLLETLSNPQNNYTMYIANRLFGQEGYSFTAEFLQDTEAYFMASLEALDFRNNPSSSRLHINEWVAQQTSDKIKDLLPDGSITVLTRLVLVNAIYFKGLWSNPFDNLATKPETFYLSASQTTQIDMMHLGKKRLNYYNSTELGCQVVELPYIGGQSSMFILLPHDIDSLSFVENRLGADSLEKMFSGFKSVDVRVSLPKFNIEQGVALDEFLKAIGMLDLFDASKADLSGMDGTKHLFVSAVIHRAFVEVNEKGTEAAGATAVIIGRRISLSKVIHFNADRPFLFLIADTKTGSVLFLGRLTKPQKQGIKNSIGFPGKVAEQRCCGSGFTNSSSTSIQFFFRPVQLVQGLWIASIATTLPFFFMHV